MNNKSIGLLKSLIKKNNHNKHQTMEINRSNRYSPTKKPKKQISSSNKLNQVFINQNLEKKRCLHKLEKNNKHKSIDKDNIDINIFYKNNNILNENSIPINYKNNQNFSKTIINTKNKNYNTSLQKKTGCKSYVDLFQNNIYNNNDYIKLGAGKTISNSVYDKVYDFENNNNSNDINNFNNYKIEMNNTINILINYINIIKKEYEKIILKKLQSKEKEISKLKTEKEFLIKENKKLKYTILQMFYCIKKYEANKNKDKNNEKNSLNILKQLIDENIYLRTFTDKTNNINKSYYTILENDIRNQIIQKELLLQKNISEEEKNIEKNDEQIVDNNPFKINNNSNNATSKINHKRQKTQFKLGFPGNIGKIEENEKEKNSGDVLSGYIKVMNNNNMLMSKAKNSSQKNLLLKNKNNTNDDKNKENKNEEKNNISDNSDNENSSLSNSVSTDSIIHNKDNINNESNKEKDNTNKIIDKITYSSIDDKYIKRIEFTK